MVGLQIPYSAWYTDIYVRLYIFLLHFVDHAFVYMIGNAIKIQYRT